MSRPPVTTSPTRRDRRSSNVSGPGQHVSASTAAGGGTSATHRSRSPAAPMWTISGWLAGRALDGEHAGDRGRLLGVGAESVHRLGRDDRQPAGCDARRDTLGVLGDQLGGEHVSSVWCARELACARSRQTRDPTTPRSWIVGADVVWIGHAPAPPRPRSRPHLQRRVHGAEPVGGRVAPRRRPHDARRHRHARSRSSSPT